MKISVGDKLPDTLIHVKINGSITDTSLADWSAGKKVVLLTVPGAFTPTCSEKHLPGYITLADDLKAKGIDAIGCLSVNDAHVMAAWGAKVGATDKVDMLADAHGLAAHAMGLDVVTTPVLGKNRAGRMALVAENSVVTQLYIEEPGAFSVSAAEYVMDRL